MDADRLDPAHTALLFFDMLNAHVKKDDPATRTRYAPVIANATRLLEGARAANMMVAYAAAAHRADNATSTRTIRDADNRLRPLVGEVVEQDEKPAVVGGTWGSQVIDELAPRPEDYLVPKYRWSALYQTYLDLALRARGVNTLVISGGSTDVGVASTVFAARDMDYNVVVVRDACTSPEQDNHDQLMNRMFPRMARVRTTDQVLRMLAAPALAPT